MIIFLRKYWLINTIVGLAIVVSLYIYYRDKTFVKNNYKLYTGIENFTAIKEIHDNHHSYIETRITSSDKRKLVERFAFVDKLDYKGKVSCSYINNDNQNKYLYYINYDGYGPYGYILFALDKTENILIIFEEWGN